MRIKQISFDVVVTENVDGVELATKMRLDLAKMGYKIIGFDFNYDATDDYKKIYPNLLNSQNK